MTDGSKLSRRFLNSSGVNSKSKSTSVTRGKDEDLRSKQRARKMDESNLFMESNPSSGMSHLPVGEVVRFRVELFEETTNLPLLSSSSLSSLTQRNRPDEIDWDDLSLEDPEPIGQGTFSQVYKVKYNSKTLALKCLDCCAQKKRKPDNSDATFRTGAVDIALEAKLLGRLSHPHIIQMHAEKKGNISQTIESIQDPYFILVDYLSDTLEDRLDKWRPLEEDEHKNPTWLRLQRQEKTQRKVVRRVQDCCLGISKAMQYLHSLQIIFRDLKPQNIGFDATTGLVKLFDFGIARELRTSSRRTASSSSSLHRTKLGFAGTPRYMAPEVRSGDYGLPADVYSFGVVLWEVVTLQQPTAAAHVLSTSHQRSLSTAAAAMRQQQRPRLFKVWHTPELKELIGECWEPVAEERPRFREIVRRLERICDTVLAMDTAASSSVASGSVEEEAEVEEEEEDDRVSTLGVLGRSHMGRNEKTGSVKPPPTSPTRQTRTGPTTTTAGTKTTTLNDSTQEFLSWS